MGKHAAAEPVTEGAANRNLSAEQFHKRSGGIPQQTHMHSNATQRPKHEATRSGPSPYSSAALRARGL